MIPILEDSVLGSDLDAQSFDLLNVNALIPVPANLATSDNPALTDQRPPVPGSVTNASVAAGAAIDQSKLNLNGQIPTAWLGNTATTATQGNLAEYQSNKNQPGGYAGLDGTGKVPPARLPGTAGTGTVTSVALTMPSGFTVSGSPLSGSGGTIAVAWSPVSDGSWFGNKSGAPASPQFYTTPVPPSMIPSLDASKVTSGVFSPSLLPVAVGMGALAAPGAVPSPGTAAPGVFPTDYLGRDMVYHNLPDVVPAYQPTLPNPTLTPDTTVSDPVAVTIKLVDSGGVNIEDEHHVFFYSTTSAATGFKEFPDTHYVKVTHPTTVWAYVAHAGFNNSAIVNLPV